MVVKTLVGAATPSDNVAWPIVMIVDSTPGQRVTWDKACRLVGVRHHFADLKSALRRVAEGFPIVGIILDHERNNPDQVLAMSSERKGFIDDLVKFSYSGPLVGANLWPAGQPDYLLREAAEKLGIPVLVDDGTADVLLDCAGMLSWCLDN